MFPVEAQTTVVAPASSALDTATVIPRSLKLPVGFAPSREVQLDAEPVRERGAVRSGVEPSPSVTTGVDSLTGNRSRYRSIQ